VQFQGYGRALCNPLRRTAEPQQLVRVQALR
jgi:hypothetical protein